MQRDQAVDFDATPSEANFDALAEADFDAL